MRKFLEDQNYVFQPEAVDILVAVLDDTWETAQSSSVLSAVVRETPDAREILAKAIIASATDGERNPFRLREDALSHLTKTISARATRSAASDTDAKDKIG
jgi:hypothetical protein